MATLIRSVLEHMLALEGDWRFGLLSNWAHIVGPLHEQMRVERIAGQTLIIGVYDSHWMQELFLLSRTLVRSINTYLGKHCIEKIHFKLVEKNRDAYRQTAIRQDRQHLAMRALTNKEQQALDCVPDNELQDALKAFLVRIVKTSTT